MRKLDDKGNIAIILCIFMTVLLGFTAYVVDIGLAYVEKAHLSNALDSAALAATLELPNDDNKAKSVANDYLEKNGINPNDAVVIIGNDYKSVQIDGVKNVNHLFAKILGINNSEVKAKTKAVIGPIKSIKNGIRPFAVEIYDFTYGDLVTLKEGASDGYHGNYKAVSLGGQGSSIFKENALYGYNGAITVGDYIDTEPGDMTGATVAVSKYIQSENSTFDNFARDSIRLWVIPLVDSLVVNGRNQVMVSGFGEFYVEDVFNKSGKIQITGRFIRYVTNGEVDTNLRDTGAYGAKLSK